MSEQLGWVATRSGAVYAALHLPAAGHRATAVLLVPPFGWEGVSAGRNLRAWARDLAAAGYPVLRYQPPGSGDSEGDATEQDVASWSAAVVDLVAELRRATGCPTVTAIGLGLGGLTVLQAVSDGAEVDDVVLWATPGKGRLLLRELRAFAALAGEPGEETSAAPQPLEAVTTDDGALWVHGYPLGPSAQAQLTALDAAALDLSRVRRAAVLGRGSLPPDRKLGEALAAAGAEVTVEPGPGYDELTVEPRLSQRPAAVAERVLAWLRPDEGAPATGGLTLVSRGEERVVVGTAEGVATRVPGAELTAVFVGAGPVNRAGPNRLWADAARRWADWGVSSIRLDLHDVGEAPGHDAYPFGPEGYYDEAYRGEIRAVLDQAPELGLPDRFVLVGMCSGAYWSAQLALDDPRVAGAVALNPVSLVWPPPLLSSHQRGYLVSAETWQRFFRDPRLRREAALQVKHSAQVAVSRLRRGGRLLATTLDVLRALATQGTPVTLGVSPGETVLADLEHLAPDANVVVRRFSGPEGAHTLSTAGLRAQAAELMDEAVRTAQAAVRTPLPR